MLLQNVFARRPERLAIRHLHGAARRFQGLCGPRRAICGVELGSAPVIHLLLHRTAISRGRPATPPFPQITEADLF